MRVACDTRTDGPNYHSQDRVSIAGGLVFWATVCKTVRPMLAVRSLSVLSVTLVYCGQTVGRIKMKLGMQYGGRLSLGEFVRWGPSPPPERGTVTGSTKHIR